MGSPTLARPLVRPDVEAGVATWLLEGERDPGRWAANGLGIWLHDKQIDVLTALLDPTRPETFFLLSWALRAGKTTIVDVAHLLLLYYKPGLAKPRHELEYELWLAEDYGTLHTAPLNELSGRAFSTIRDILTGTSRAQQSETGERRPAPLAPLYTARTERDMTGADHMSVRCATGGHMDFRSTEGGAGRLESGQWRFVSWDEWPQQENVEQIEDPVLNRLMARVSDHDGRILLTGTITERTEHIAKRWIDRCEDVEDTDWWGTTASRLDNPATSARSVALAERQLDASDYDRTVLGKVGGVKNRLFPASMLAPVFSEPLPRFTPPGPDDGAAFVEGQRGPRPRAPSDYAYLHLWDVAIAAADNAGLVLRYPASGIFGPEAPAVGVKLTIIPGSRTLTTPEIIHTIEETFLPYGGRIVVDTTDAHGKSIARQLRQAGYPAEDFDFHGRDSRGVMVKDRAIAVARTFFTEGLVPLRDAQGEIRLDAEGVPRFEAPAGRVGVLRLPPGWGKAYDQLAILRTDDAHQRKDVAMTVLMGLYRLWRLRRTTSGPRVQTLAVFSR